MGKTQEIERLAAICRSIHPDDVIDDDSNIDLMIRLELVSQALDKQQEEQERLSQEINALFKKVYALRSAIEARETASKRQHSIQVITMRIPIKSYRKLVRSA